MTYSPKIVEVTHPRLQRAVFIPPYGPANPSLHDFLPCDLDPPCTDPEVCHLEMELPVMCRAEREEHKDSPRPEVSLGLD